MSGSPRDSHNIVREYFEQIGDFNSTDQVRTAINAMPTYETKKMIIDKVLLRRDEIKLSQENFKIMKYGHIFRRFLSKFRASKQLKLTAEKASVPDNQKDLGLTTTKLNDDEVAHTTNVENSMAVHSNQDSILDTDRKIIISDSVRQKFLENAIMSFQPKRQSKEDSLPRLNKLSSLNTLSVQAQRDKEDKKKNVQESSEFLIMQAKLKSEAKYLRKEKLSKLVKQAVSKIDTGIKQTRLSTLRGQREEDERLENDFTHRRRQGRVLNDNGQMLSLDLEQRLLSQRDMSKRNSYASLNDRTLPTLEEPAYQTVKLPHLRKYFTITDPFQVREQVEEEIFDFLMEQKTLNPMQKELFLRSDPKVQTKTIRNMESRIKNNIKVHFLHERDIFNKYTYSVAEILGKKLPTTSSLNDLKFRSLQLTQQQAQTSRALRKTLQIQQKAAIQELDESFASYTEIKLNNLYMHSKEIQGDIKSQETTQQELKKVRIQKERFRKHYENQLVRTAKEIIDLSSRKMSNKTSHIVQ